MVRGIFRMASNKLTTLKMALIVAFIVLLMTIKRFDLIANSKRRFPNGQKSELFKKDFLKVFHLDLKGAPPKMEFLLKVLPIVRKTGANAILIEYEDTFPFSGRLRNISAENAYTLAEVKRLVRFAESLHMDVIPLVQTFGHLEYVLKLEEFQGLRELESFPQEICPLNREAVDLVKEMIKQYMAVHPNARYIHIGCDEVRHVGACSRCSRTNPKKLFTQHVTKIADHVRAEYPGVTPLIWDDMLRRWTFFDVANSGLGSVVELVVWAYADEIQPLVPPLVWKIYGEEFPRVWVASAFKGAFGETEILPNLTRHLENHFSWMRVLSGEGSVRINSEVSGIFLTGWSRYDHFAVLCELLPVGIPSLILDLTFLDPEVRGNHLEGFSRWLKILQCPYIPSSGQNEKSFRHKLGRCSFPGSKLYSRVLEFESLRARVRKVKRRVESSGWAAPYNLEKNFTSPWRLLELFPEEGFAGEILRKEISVWKKDFASVMEEYFDKHTREEWEEQNVNPLEKTLEEIQTNFQKLLGRKTWPRRPIR